MAIIKVTGYRCERCSYEWAPKSKGVVPVICPRCKSPYWNRPAKNPKKKKIA